MSSYCDVLYIRNYLQKFYEIIIKYSLNIEYSMCYMKLLIV